MKVVGFSFIRNAIKYDYPIVEAILSVLPLCDEFILAVGKSEDETKEMILKLEEPKIKIIDTVWDDSLREGGKILAQQTNIAFKAIPQDADWAFYIQGDEIFPEQYIENVKSALLKWKDDKTVDGLLFNYKHFYGSYDYVGNSEKWYKREIRIVKNDKSIYSYRDAQGFRKGDNQKLNVKPIDAYIYHYGWVKPPAVMQSKQETFHKLWHSDDWVNSHIAKSTEFDYSEIDSLELFQQEHPIYMQERIKAKNWKFDFHLSRNRTTLKNKFKRFVFNWFGIEIGYKNYKVI